MPEDLWPLLVGSLVATWLVAQLLRGASQQRSYLILLGVDLGLLGLAHAIGPSAGALAFVAEGLGVVLVLAPVVLDSLERRMLRRGDLPGLRRATRIAQLRERLVPGRAATTRRRVLEHRLAARGSEAEAVLRALEAERASARDPEQARQLTAELVMLRLGAGQIDAGLDQAQRQLDEADYDRSPALTSAVIAALSERGRLREAGPLLALLESQAAGRDVSAQPFVIGARLAFIAGAGLTDPLEELLAQRAIAEVLDRGEAARLRTIAVAITDAEPEGRYLAEELARRLLAFGRRASEPLRRRSPATVVLLGANLVVAALVTGLGLGSEELGLARAGALWGPAVELGEWWRLVSGMFLHAGFVHLAMNASALYLLGRAVEQLLGSARLLVVYAVAGLGGALASLWADRGLSVGASGAIMGLLAALTAVVVARRHAFHPGARRMLLGNLLFLGALQAFLGWQIPMIDSAAHAGGFVAGLAATLGVGLGEELGRLGRGLTRGAATLFLLVCATSAFLVLRHPIGPTLLALPTTPVEVDGVLLVAPRSFGREGKDLLVDRYLGIQVQVSRTGEQLRLGSPQADDPRVRPLLERLSASARPASQGR